MKIQIKNGFTNAVIIEGEYVSIKDCLVKNRYANLRYAYLRDANLRDANLRDANLRYAYLQGAKEYSQSHDFFSETVRRVSIKVFTTSEWKCIAVISIHRICWETIKKQFGKTAMSVFKKLSKVGFEEWEKYYKEFCEGKE